MGFPRRLCPSDGHWLVFWPQWGFPGGAATAVSSRRKRSERLSSPPSACRRAYMRRDLLLPSETRQCGCDAARYKKKKKETNRNLDGGLQVRRAASYMETSLPPLCSVPPRPRSGPQEGPGSLKKGESNRAKAPTPRSRLPLGRLGVSA